MTLRDQSTPRPSAESGQRLRERRDLAGWRTRHQLRRCSAAQPHRNRKRYYRKQKHRGSTVWI